MSEQPTEGRAPRTLTYQELRRAVEAAASFRNQEVYLVVDDQGWSVREKRPENPDGMAVVPIRSPGKPTAPPPVLVAQIVVDVVKPADLLNLKDPQGKPLGSADDVFWTPAAVEKFLVPYYASVYGDAKIETYASSACVSASMPVSAVRVGGMLSVSRGSTTAMSGTSE